MSLEELKAAAVAMLDRAYCLIPIFLLARRWNAPMGRYLPAATLKMPFIR